MKEYICQIATIDEMERKWNYEIRRQRKRKIVLERLKNNALEYTKNGQSVTYYGKIHNRIICETTAMFDEDIIQNSDKLVDDKTVYLCNFSTVKRYRGKGYFSKLFRFMINDLKNRGYKKFTLGVEPAETKNLNIYQHLGFNKFIKSAQETFPDGTVIDVDYYGNILEESYV